MEKVKYNGFRTYTTSYLLFPNTLLAFILVNIVPEPSSQLHVVFKNYLNNFCNLPFT